MQQLGFTDAPAVAVPVPMQQQMGPGMSTSVQQVLNWDAIASDSLLSINSSGSSCTGMTSGQLRWAVGRAPSSKLWSFAVRVDAISNNSPKDLYIGVGSSALGRNMTQIDALKDAWYWRTRSDVTNTQKVANFCKDGEDVAAPGSLPGADVGHIISVLVDETKGLVQFSLDNQPIGTIDNVPTSSGSLRPLVAFGYAGTKATLVAQPHLLSGVGGQPVQGVMAFDPRTGMPVYVVGGQSQQQQPPVVPVQQQLMPAQQQQPMPMTFMAPGAMESHPAALESEPIGAPMQQQGMTNNMMFEQEKVLVQEYGLFVLRN